MTGSSRLRDDGGTRPGDDRPPAVVVLGAMFGARYPALLPAAQRRGLAVLGIDNPSPNNRRTDEARRRDPGHPLAGLADLAWLAPTAGDEILDRVIAWSAEYRIAAVVVFGEAHVSAGGVVADCLGLRGPGLRASRVCRDKLLQRRYLAFCSPRSQLVTPAERDGAAQRWDSWPAIVKPTGREASSGVRRVADAAALHAALRDYEPDEPVLVEQLVTGHELSVESLVAGGRVVFAAATGKQTNESGGAHFVEMGHTVPDPTLSAAQLERVREVNAAVLARLDFADGVAHAEYRVDASGAPILMEVAARPAGDSIFTLYHLATGTPLEETLLAILLGEPASHPAPRRYARQVYLPHEPGVLRDVRAEGLSAPVTWLAERSMWPPVTPLRADEPAAVHMVVAGRPAGTRLQAIRESSDRSAMFVIDAASPEELDRLEARCRAAIRVEVDPAASGAPVTAGAR